MPTTKRVYNSRNVVQTLTPEIATDLLWFILYTHIHISAYIKLYIYFQTHNRNTYVLMRTFMLRVFTYDSHLLALTLLDR